MSHPKSVTNPKNPFIMVMNDEDQLLVEARVKHLPRPGDRFRYTSMDANGKELRHITGVCAHVEHIVCDWPDGHPVWVGTSTGTYVYLKDVEERKAR